MYVLLKQFALHFLLRFLRKVYGLPSRLPPLRMFLECSDLYVPHPGSQANIIDCLQVILGNPGLQHITLVRSQNSGTIDKIGQKP